MGNPPPILQCLDAILALVEEIRVTGTVSHENLSGVRALVGKLGSEPDLDVEAIRQRLEAEIPKARDGEAYRDVGNVSQADLRYEVRSGAEGPSAPAGLRGLRSALERIAELGHDVSSLEPFCHMEADQCPACIAEAVLGIPSPRVKDIRVAAAVREAQRAAPAETPGEPVAALREWVTRRARSWYIEDATEFEALLAAVLRSPSTAAPPEPSQQAVEDLAWVLQTTPDLVVQGDGLVVAKAILERYPFRARGDLTK